MELDEVMRSTGSTRYYQPDTIPDGVIYKVLDNARFASSGGNRQGWRVAVVTDPGLRSRLHDLYLLSWRPYHADRLERAVGNPAALRLLAAANEYADALAQVPIHLVVAVDLAALVLTDAELPRPSIVGGASVYPFVQNVLLGLRQAGLGSCLTTLLVPQEAAVRELLHLPDGFGLAAHIGAGRPAKPFPTRLTRRAVEGFATRDGFGGPTFGG